MSIDYCVINIVILAPISQNKTKFKQLLLDLTWLSDSDEHILLRGHTYVTSAFPDTELTIAKSYNL